MIQQQTILKVIDNSGAKTVKCIKVLGGFKRKFAHLGDVIIVSINNLRNKSKKSSKVKKGDVFKALIIQTKNSQTNKDGSCYHFSKNSVSLITKQGKPVASRISVPVSKKIKQGKFSKFSSISIGII